MSCNYLFEFCTTVCGDMKKAVQWIRTTCCVLICLAFLINSYFWQILMLTQRTRRETSNKDLDNKMSKLSFTMDDDDNTSNHRHNLHLFGLDDKNSKLYLSRQIFISKQVKANYGGCLSYPNMYYAASNVSLTKNKGLSAWNVFEQDRTVRNVNCHLLFENDREMKNIKRFNTSRIKRNVKNVHDVFNLTKTKDCAKYIQGAGYITSSLTEKEELFPIAFSILVYKDIQQFEMLFRAIYRPQNVYCIHYDEKMNGFSKFAIRNIARCFENVFISSKIFDVEWGTMTVLLPELACMKYLLKYKKWKYFINLTGQEFPLRTNYELVKILKIFNGANNIESIVKRANKERWKDNPNPPHNILPIKGSVHITASRDFVDYLINNYTALDFVIWTSSTKIPDETYFASLNHNPHLKAPGSIKGKPETDCKTKPHLTRFKNWGTYTCHGKWVRSVCIFGIGDLPLLASRQELFANKFHFDYQPYTYQCMDELIFNRTRDEYFGVLKFDTTMYESLEFSKNNV